MVWVLKSVISKRFLEILVRFMRVFINTLPKWVLFNILYRFLVNYSLTTLNFIFLIFFSTKRADSQKLLLQNGFLLSLYVLTFWYKKIINIFIYRFPVILNWNMQYKSTLNIWLQNGLLQCMSASPLKQLQFYRQYFQCKYILRTCWKQKWQAIGHRLFSPLM